MGIERESFVGNPNKIDILDDEDDEAEYFSGDEIDFIPFVLESGDPDLMLHDNLDILSDEDDEDYNPADDYEDFLSDSDFIADGTDGSGIEDAEECDSDQDTTPPDASSNTHEPTTKVLGENKTPENKIIGETKSNPISSNSSNEDDANT